MKLLLTSSGISNPSIHDVLVDLLGKPIAESSALFVPTAIYPFPGGPGNTSFEGGDFPTIIESIERRIFAKFDPGTRVLPGHGTATTVGSESPHLQEWVDRGW